MTRSRPYTSLPRRAYLGAAVKRDGPALVVRVGEPSTAARAGVLAGDVIIGIDAKPVKSAAELLAMARTLSVGEPVCLMIDRHGTQIELTADVAPLPKENGTVSLDHVVGGDGQRLRTIHTTPDTARAAVLYLQSSDWGSCEHPLTPAHPVWRLMSGLTDAGLATLRVERSGTGDSEGPPSAEVDFAKELVGYRAGLAQLRERHDLVFLLGNSLGGMVAPLLADDDLAGIAVIGTSASTWHECLLGSFCRQQERSTRELEHLTELQERVLRGGATPAEVYAALPLLTRFAHYEGELSYGRTVRFFQQLEAADLRSAWVGVHVPVLALHGSQDWICTAEDARAIVDLVGPRATLHELDGVDHGLAAEGAVAKVVAATVAWIDDVLRR